jgi:hypothetical protein
MCDVLGGKERESLEMGLVRSVEDKKARGMVVRMSVLAMRVWTDGMLVRLRVTPSLARSCRSLVGEGQRRRHKHRYRFRLDGDIM